MAGRKEDRLLADGGGAAIVLVVLLGVYAARAWVLSSLRWGRRPDQKHLTKSIVDHDGP